MKTGILILLIMAAFVAPTIIQAADRPNILWITNEDCAPHLGCYGDTYAQTPNLDALAAKGVLYKTCWSSAPVCAPARTAIITGVSPTSTGAEHMRSLARPPSFMRMLPQYLREAGYYCTNNVKEDYNLEKPGKVWDESSKKAHWRNRAKGQPFFAVFNITETHESQIRARPHEWKHDPAKVKLPAYHPDIPETRQDWAQYYDQMTIMDGLAGGLLKNLLDDGLAEDTIVFYYGDNGPGMPRGKRMACDSGLRVPLIVYVPPKYKHLAPKGYASAGRSDRLVGFEDLAPTALSLAGIRPPEWMQGRALMGQFAASDPQYIFGFRGRMDERYDCVRSVRDTRYVYVRNYMPHLPNGQHMAYMFETPSTMAWKQLFDAGKLDSVRAAFWLPRAPEELYDLQSDPYEIKNLADSSEHREILVRLRGALREHILAVRDVGFLPEGEIHERSSDSSPYELGHDENKYPLERILNTAEAASMLTPEALPALQNALEKDADSAVRYWAAMGIRMRGKDAVTASEGLLRKALHDKSPYVRIVAAESLGLYGPDAGLDESLAVLLELADLSKQGYYIAVSALGAIDALGPRADRIRAAVVKLPRTDSSVHARMENSIPRLLESIQAADGSTKSSSTEATSQPSGKRKPRNPRKAGRSVGVEYLSQCASIQLF